MAETVESHVNNLRVGEDVIPKRIGAEIYSALIGIDDVTVRVQEISGSGVPPVPGNWQTTRLSVDNDRFANTTSNDIMIV